MFGQLFLKECKSIAKSIIYFLFVIILVFDFVVQLGSYTGVTKPEVGQKSYGTRESDDPEDIMKRVLERLLIENRNNEYYTYPIGFVKIVKLTEEEQEKVFEILDYFLAANSEEIQIAYETGQIYSGDFLVELSPNVSYDEFKEKMQEIADLLGKGSFYEPDELMSKGSVEMSYEEAMEEYQTFLEEDNISDAYARVFGDYLGIFLAILPVFLAVARVLRERRSKVEETIYSKKASGGTVVLARYIATVVMAILPVFLISITPACQMMYNARCNGVTGNWLALPEVILGWLLPTVIVTVAIGFFLTELTGSVVAIFLQGIWWFLDLNMNSNIVGMVGLHLIPRFNTIGRLDLFETIFPELVQNRIMYTIMGLFFVASTILIYDLKRKGVLVIHGKISLHRKEQS